MNNATLRHVFQCCVCGTILKIVLLMFWDVASVPVKLSEMGRRGFSSASTSAALSFLSRIATPPTPY
ncbi:hypothetical protein P153DRAFT_5121 [Dothidotthia symphoricarpi CBS 119687]|uniref:Uncharacterized protein n=1 Tax=Dothidotthia symphoricarpi CBS 119687 TaxID=1392245 RepID=A0A6A6AS07_9PLEO|nr:uncharacterized protein P153DRAFT_5121 [Dothidotthia symphoricarpi CBS 119687]KAF2134580.1 hypothetical protein P153DRAFT_5121 [Dothidotthia symphoricarpi CBS 119687]